MKEKVLGNLQKQVANWSKYELIYGLVIVTTLLSISIIGISPETPIWLTIISIIAGFTGVLGTMLAAKKSTWNYLWGIIHIVLYGTVSLASGVYGDFVLNIFYFLPLNIYAVFVWRGMSDKNGIVKPKKLSKKYAVITFVSTMVGWVSFALILTAFGDVAPWLDSFSTVFSVVGMILMMKAYKEQYYIWTAVNIISVLMWIVSLSLGNSAAIPMIIMWSCYVLNGLWGLYNWSKKPEYVGNRPISGSSTGTKAIYK